MLISQDYTITKLRYLLIGGGLTFSLLFEACTHDQDISQVVSQNPINNSTELQSSYTKSAPSIDGKVDAEWEALPSLTNETEVPNPGNGLFTGYIGEKYSFSLKSMYDDQNIYFLAQWGDQSKGKGVQSWYFNPATKRWIQESNSKTFDVNGVMTRDAMGMDQLAFQWNIDNSVKTFSTQSCYSSCHLFTPYRNYAGIMIPNKSGNHYTNLLTEKLDLWWLRLDKELMNHQMDDQYIDYAGGPSVVDTVGGNGNGRHADDLVPPTPFNTSYINTNTNPSNGPINNRVSLKLDGTGASVNVPAWIIPNAQDIDFISSQDTTSEGRARKVTGVSSNGVHSYNGGTLNPDGDNEFLQRPGVHGGLGSKCIPGFISGSYSGSRADFLASGTFTSQGWTVEFKRALNTHNSLKQDVNFESLSDHPFGIAIWNNANNQHAIKTGLVLKFKSK